MMDEVPPELLSPVFNYVFDTLCYHRHLDNYRCIGGDLLIALDGTDYHNSKRIHCENGNVTNHRNGTITYSHKVIRTKVVVPGNDIVISLEPEFITKQDCEHEAAKRWLNKYSTHYRALGITILGDDLFCNQPMCLAIGKAGFNFILGWKPESHQTLYEWVDFLTNSGGIQSHINRRFPYKESQTDTYRFVNEVPIRDGEDALIVNWCEITTTKADGTIIYQNAFATNHSITEANVVEVVTDGRARWKIENENHNTLKTKGYHLEHNFGHGKKYLASVFLP